MARRYRKLHKIDWLVVDETGKVLVEVQEDRSEDTGHYQAAYMDRADYAVGSGYYHLTNDGKGLAVDPANQEGLYSALGSLRGYLFYSHGPSQVDAIVKPAAGIIPAPKGYRGGTYLSPSYA